MPAEVDVAALLASVRARLTMFRATPGFVAAPGARFREAVRDVVLIGSSSRGGSSIFAEILRSTPQLLHFRAEVNPFLVLAGCSWPQSGTGSDGLDERHGLGGTAGLDALATDLAYDCGTAAEGLPDDQAVLRFTVDLACRLTMQWPQCTFSLATVRAAVDSTLAALREDHGWAVGAFPDAQRFHALFLARIRRTHPVVNPYFYDLNRALVAAHCPDSLPGAGPPSPFLIEEPPFVTIGPWHPAEPFALATRPLVIKTPSNAYRLPFLQAIFPNANLRILHLTRNVAASVNGLYDGWRFAGFHSHAVGNAGRGPLRIAGYTDAFPGSGERWWKFDLPPGWSDWTGRGLEEVCGFQWRSAHEALLRWLDADPVRNAHALRLRFEDIVGSRPRREEAFATLVRWLGIGIDAPLERLLGGSFPTVMATETPRHQRWFKRADLLSPVLADPASQALMERLGYANDPRTWT